jgi:hypothetical protein
MKIYWVLAGRADHSKRFVSTRDARVNKYGYFIFKACAKDRGGPQPFQFQYLGRVMIKGSLSEAWLGARHLLTASLTNQ